jgi:cytoskeletal protein CcmA (bactofilin family)
MTHFDEMTALLYLENQLRPDTADGVRAHASECSECRDLLEALNRESIWLRESLETDDEMVPARLIQVPEKGSAPWGWIAALALGIGGAYTVWNGFIEPWRAQAAEAGFTQGNLLTMLFFSGAFWKGWDAMRSMIEFTALATVGILVLWLVRKHLSNVAPAVVAMAGLTLAAAFAAPAANAGQVEHGSPNYTLPADQTVKTDLIVFADTTRIEGNVDGDLIVWSQNATVTGHVKGDVIAFTQDLRVEGPVGGNVRVFSQRLELSSTVERNVSAWVGNLSVSPGTKIGGSMILGTGDAILEGSVGGDVQAYGADFDLNGPVGGNLYIRAKDLRVGKNAVVAGTAAFHGRHPASVDAAAKFAQPLQTTIISEDYGDRYSSLGYYWHQVLRWGAAFVFGLVFLLLAPTFFFDASNALNRYAPSVGFGVLFLFAVPIAAILVCFTIVGLGVGISTIMIWLISMYAAQVVVGRWVGEKILGAGEPGMGPALGRLALGLLILRLISMLPYVGGWVMFLVVVWGIGGMVLAVNRRLHQSSPAALSVAA